MPSLVRTPQDWIDHALGAVIGNADLGISRMANSYVYMSSRDTMFVMHSMYGSDDFGRFNEFWRDLCDVREVQA